MYIESKLIVWNMIKGIFYYQYYTHTHKKHPILFLLTKTKKKHKNSGFILAIPRGWNVF